MPSARLAAAWCTRIVVLAAAFFAIAVSGSAAIEQLRSQPALSEALDPGIAIANNARVLDMHEAGDGIDASALRWLAPAAWGAGATAVVKSVAAETDVEGALGTQAVAWGPAPVAISDQPPPKVSAKAAIVLDEASMAVLYGKNEHDSMMPASTTKMATAILAIERGNLEDVVAFHNVDSRQMAGSSLMGIHPRDRFTLRDLVYGLMLPSGNDAALAIGRHISGSDEAFVAEMNALLERLDLDSSHFSNPHGLNAPDHRASAYDLAMLARYGMQLPEFAEIVGTSTWTANGSRTIELESRIKGFLQGYNGADGVKSGFTRAGGQTLVASATRDGRRVYVVLLTTGDRDNEAAALLDWAFITHAWPATGQQALHQDPEYDEPQAPGEEPGVGRGRAAHSEEHPGRGQGGSPPGHHR